MSKVTSIRGHRSIRLKNPSMRALMANPQFKALASVLASRGVLANIAGITFNGARDYYQSLGYDRVLFPAHYRSRYNRDAVAARIVEAKPQSTWRGGGEVIEDSDPSTETDFEKAWSTLNDRLKLWSMFQRTDILSGIGRYGVLFLGGPGKIDTPLKKMKPEEFAYLAPYSEADAPIQTFEIDQTNARFGRPIFYSIARMTASSAIIPPPEITGSVADANFMGGRRVHYTRVLHVADNLLDSHVYGIPRLERCWNLLDDLMKVTGGGAEAYWRRADAGLQVDVDPDMELEPDDEVALDDTIDRYIHRLDRVVRTRGVKMNPLTSQVAGIKDPIDGIMSQLSAGTGIPQRILMGSERGQLASTQDDDNWTERIVDRRRDFASPMVVRPLVDFLISVGALPAPKQYSVGWPEIDNLDETQRAGVAIQWSEINKNMQEEVVTPDEIRDRLLGLPPRAEQKILAAAKNPHRFAMKWRCLSRNARMAWLEKNHPGEMKNYATERASKKGRKR